MTPPSPALVDGLRALAQKWRESAAGQCLSTGNPWKLAEVAMDDTLVKCADELDAALPALLDTLARLAGERDAYRELLTDAIAHGVMSRSTRERLETRFLALAANPQGATDERA